MKIGLLLTASLSLLALATQPAIAADDFRNNLRNSDEAPTKAGFAGFHLRMNLGDGRARPNGRLGLGLVKYGSRFEAGPQRSYVPTLALGFSRRGKPEFYVMDQRLTDVQKRLGIAPAAAIAIGVGVAAAGTVVVVSMDDDEPRCLLPEKELCTQE